ncbi:hypothetical protein WJX73_004296 [Symbiochloris irregularis]|uniref:Oxidoreductase n=1 Tax=Symbiochloris irregularis TaxID=706552 RepID=A0AAW1PLU1_9CHLO
MTETSSSGRKLHLGILSAAGIAKKNVRGILKNTNGIEVVAVAARSLDKAKAFIKETGIEGKAKAYGSYDELLDDANIHAVYIPLPAGLRPQWVKKAAAKGKHVLGEKPVALTNKETEELISACREAGVQYMDGTMWLHNPRAHYMKEIISNKKLFGEPKSVTTCFYMAADEDFKKNDVRAKKDLDGLGCLGDIGWYCLTVTLFAFNYDAPSQVQAHIGAKFNDEGVPMHCGATLTWADGRQAMFDCGFDQNFTQLANVGGSESFIQWTDFCIPTKEDSCEFSVVGPGGLSDLDTRINQDNEVKKVYLDRPQETRMWEDFAECIYAIQDGKKPDDHWPSISELTSKCVLAVAESIENGCKVVEFKA